MKNEKEIRWIQLSDLHMFISTDVERQKKALYKQFGDKTDLILVTGDLHQYGTDYDMTIDFLNELVVQFGIEKRDVVIVPGNHDITASDKRKRAIQKIDENIENNPDVYIDELNKLYLGFRKYMKFLSKFYGNCIEGYNLLKNNIYIWRNKLAILCINTALASDEEHSKPQIIDIYELEKLDNQKLPCIAIIPNNIIRDFVNELDWFGINRSFIYPDFDRLAYHLDYKAKGGI